MGVSNILSAVSPVASLLLSPKPKAPKAPEVVAPAPPAPARRDNTGANLRIGADAADSVRNRRTSGRKTRTSTNVLGGLGGRSGLNI